MESEVSESALIYTATIQPPSSSLPEKTLDYEEKEIHRSPSPSTSPKQLKAGISCTPSSLPDKTLDHEEETHQSPSPSTSPVRIESPVRPSSLPDKTLDREEEALHPLSSSSFRKQMESEVLLQCPPILTAASSPPPLLENPLDDEEAQQFPSHPRFPYFSDIMPSMFPELSYFNEVKPSMMGAGLSNMGNTCFLNAILQCFTHTVPLLESLRSYNHDTPCFRSNDAFCVICTLRQHVELSLTSSGRVISPCKFVDNLSNLSSSFRRYEQEDAHEFLQCLLDRLDSCCLDLNKQVWSSSSQEDSFVKKIFGGRLKSQLRCCNCGHCSDTFEPLIDLSLEIEDVDTLPNALKSFTKVEKIEDSETKFTCEKCEQEVLLEKQFTLDQAPSVATFHLKRFKNDGYFVEKIDKYVEYPLELDLQPYTNSSENFDAKLKYELYAVVVHVGFTYSSGHYFCYIRSAPDTWHRLDDSKVVRVDEKYVLSQEAYILFYAREDTPWFSNFMEARNQCMGQNSESTSPTSVLHDFNNKFCIPPHEEKSKSIGDVEVKDVDMERISGPLPQIDTFSDEVEDGDDINVCPKTPPPRSPSPDDIYTDEPPEVSYRIPRDHLKLKGGNANLCTRSANKALEDSKRKEAHRLTRSMPSSRAMKFRACMSSSPNSEKSSKRKKRKPGMSYDVGTGREASSPLRSLRRLVDFR